MKLLTSIILLKSHFLPALVLIMMVHINEVYGFYIILQQVYISVSGKVLLDNILSLIKFSDVQ